jgi:nucleotide-binding universal stress UspA family protein
MHVLLWLVEGTWQGCVDAARPLLVADAEVTLLYVAPSEIEEAVGGAVAGLLGRGSPRPAGAPTGPPRRVDRLVVEAAQDADLLVVARDGDRHRLGPASLGPVTRFVVDHAPCPVLLVWPDQPPRSTPSHRHPRTPHRHRQDHLHL